MMKAPVLPLSKKGKSLLASGIVRLKAVLRKEILFRFVKVKMMAFLRED
ncbi:hypothetical protein [Candidatus Kuenenia stuttgartiensis]|nr:hypothetical protein [Candidatus Kuenenia stuttgartiensis]